MENLNHLDKKEIIRMAMSLMGQSKSAAKVEAARRNGRLGGRGRKRSALTVKGRDEQGSTDSTVAVL